MNSFKRTLSWIFLLALNHLFSQQLRFKHITSEDGLSTNYITCVMQDDLGFMWFGSQDGLNKYYGVGFQNPVKIFKNDPTNKTSLSNSEVTTLTQIRKDLFLVGTREGLNFFNPVTEKFSRLQHADSKKEPKINAIYRIDSANAMVGTDEGLYAINLNNRAVKHYFFSVGKKVSVNCITMINGLYYMGTNGDGLWKLDKNNQLTRLRLPLSSELKSPVDQLANITNVGQYGSKIYLGTYGNGIFKVDLATFEVEAKISFSNYNEASNSVKNFVIRSNKIFAATKFGVMVYNLMSGEIDGYSKGESSFAMNSNPCSTIFIDRENNYWVGTDVGGINVSFFQSLKFPNSNLHFETEYNNIYSFYEDTKDNILLGSGKSLQGLNLQSGLLTEFRNLPASATVLSIEKEDENIIWVGTWGNGVARFDKSTGVVRNFLSNQVGGTIVCLKIYGRNIYAGSVGDGLFKINLDNFEVTNFGVKQGLPNQSINNIFVDSKNNVWLSTYGSGLVKMKGFDRNGKLPIEKIYSNTGKAKQLASNTVFSVNEDKNGNVWAATATGLSKLMPGGKFYNFYEKDGLSNTYLYSILKDSLNNFWMSSNNGIIRFNPLQPEKEIVFKNYGVKDGLLNTEYNMGAAFVSNTGHMYFGGPKGFNTFRPLSIKDNLHAPHAYIIGYTRGGNDVQTDTLITYKKHLELSWSENFFMFEVVALDYTDPTKNKFKYKLEGYDNDWSSPTNVRYIDYKKLEGGQYTFRVKAANNDGIWNEEAYEISITVIPPFWKTKLFYILIAVIGGGGLIGFFQYRTNAVKKINKVLEKKVAERTRELEEKNRDITSSITYAKRIQEAILPSKDNIFKRLNKIFIFYQPKDIVSGDFYWFTERDGIKIFAVVDCTGHGVPGAFMSMIGHNLLHRIVIEKAIVDPAEILNSLHKGVQEALRQGHNEINTNDGMDCSIITINSVNKAVRWAGANRPLILIDAQGNFTKIDGNKFPVGGAQLDTDLMFTAKDVELKSATMAYMFTDGYADQFGGEKGKKYMVKRFHELLTTIHLRSADEQLTVLRENFQSWSKNHEQVDDVLIVGIEI